MCKQQDFIYPLGTCNELGDTYDWDKKLTVSLKKIGGGAVKAVKLFCLFLVFPCSHFRNERQLLQLENRVLHINSHSEGQCLTRSSNGWVHWTSFPFITMAEAVLINSVKFPFLQQKRWSGCSMTQQWGKKTRRGAIYPAMHSLHLHLCFDIPQFFLS